MGSTAKAILPICVSFLCLFFTKKRHKSYCIPHTNSAYILQRHYNFPAILKIKKRNGEGNNGKDTDRRGRKGHQRPVEAEPGDGGPPVRARSDGPGRHPCGGGAGVRPDAPRCDAAGHGGVRGHGEGPGRAHHLPHRPGRHHRQGPGLRPGCGRLYREALRGGGVARTGPGGPQADPSGGEGVHHRRSHHPLGRPRGLPERGAGGADAPRVHAPAHPHRESERVSQPAKAPLRGLGHGLSGREPDRGRAHPEAPPEAEAGGPHQDHLQERLPLRRISPQLSS